MTYSLGPALTFAGLTGGERSNEARSPGPFDPRSPRHSAPAHGNTTGTGLLLRGGGVMLIGLCITSIYWLSVLAHEGPRHDPTAIEYLLAAIGFAGGTGGAALMVLGAHIHDPIEISERWRPRR